MARKVLATLSASKTVWLAKGGVGGWTPQSMAFKSASTRYIICNVGNALGIQYAKENSHKTTGYRLYASGHGNGACYCSKDGHVYTTTYAGSANMTVKRWNPKNNWKLVQTIKLPVYVTGLAYDPLTQNFYTGSSSGWSVFSYSEFTKKKGERKHKSHSNTYSKVGFWQDVGGYGGIVMRCTSYQNKTSASYVDCYRAVDGKYLGSLKSYGEMESIAVDSSGHFHVLYAQNRRVVRTKQTIYSVGLLKKGSGFSSTATATANVVKKEYEGNKIVKQARKYKGEGYKRFCKWANINSDWCAIFVRYVFHKCGLDKIMSTLNYVPEDFTNQIIKRGGKIIWSRDSRFKNPSGGSKKNCKPGDIALYGGHVNIVCKASSNGTSVLTIGGNQRGGGHWSNNKVTEYERSDMLWIVRPKYKYSNSLDGGVDGEETVDGQGRLQVSPEKLSSAENYDYLTFQENEESAEEKRAKESWNKIIENAGSFNYVVGDDSAVIKLLEQSISLTYTKLPQTKVNGELNAGPLPTSLDPIEAPFVELTIGGYTFGVKSEGENYPNYIEGIKVTRTNASMNEYVINLIHQVSPGRNPNFIDELLSKNSYNKITIKYGDANTSKIFTDESALLTGSNVTFDFTSCNLKYTIKATSSALQGVTNKRNFSSVSDKGSNIIKSLLQDATSSLITSFAKMSDSNFVSRNNLIPTNDAVMTMDAFSNVNDITYLKNIVANMKSESDPYASYYLTLNDGYFKITEVSSSNASTFGAYEVNINYPDDNQVFNFKTDTDYEWPLAYDYAGGITTYSYNINSVGDISSYAANSSNIFNPKGQTNISDNWWKQATEFPATATLTCRGLLSPLLLMTYIKVNCVYYGGQRITSGVYIVTGQEDTLNGSGYRTVLSLVKVAGPQQYISIDARIKT